MKKFNPLAGADYVIVGAGSAGCALAYRLAEAGCEVLLIEHGGDDGVFLNWKIHMPAALSYPMNMPKYDWGYRTEPEESNGRSADGVSARQSARRLFGD